MIRVMIIVNLFHIVCWVHGRAVGWGWGSTRVKRSMWGGGVQRERFRRQEMKTTEFAESEEQ